MSEIKVRLLRDDATGTWSIELNGNLKESISADTVLGIVKHAMIDVEASVDQDSRQTNASL